ncbi:MAG: hypothetical protein DI539_30920, partial [Flavobacterium psychrophilum]
HTTFQFLFLQRISSFTTSKHIQTMNFLSNKHKQVQKQLNNGDNSDTGKQAKMTAKLGNKTRHRCRSKLLVKLILKRRRLKVSCG